MARRGYTAYEQRPNLAEERRRKREALRARTADNATGFMAPQQQGVSAGTTQPQMSLSDFARYSSLKGQYEPMVQRTQQREGRRYGQQQGFGGGYVPPRQAIGGFRQPYGQQQQNPNYYGYAPQTAGMYGGRPTSGYGGYPMNQQQAMMRPQYSYGAQVQQPWGGYQAVQRQQQYYPQNQYYGRGWY